jgi:Protein of unknown function (DUF707)
MAVSVISKMPSPKHKNLVYTSAGDRSNLARWLGGSREFDLWITYYGDNSGRYENIADYYNDRKGGKFPNLHDAYQAWPDVFDRYEAILVMDDDIIIDAGKINRLFDIRSKYDLWIIQPAFDPRGKISHRITQANAGTFIRYTNFVEMNCPLFRKDKLLKFLNIYDPVLTNWGIDWWYCEVLGPDLRNKVAIADDVTCINPYNFMKKGRKREINRLRATGQGKVIWQKIKKRYHIKAEEKGQKEYGSVKNSIKVSSVKMMWLYMKFMIGKIIYKFDRYFFG